MSYDDWLCSTPEQKQRVREGWDVYERDGLGIVLCAAGRLVLSSKIKIYEAVPGTYHGGEWVIHASIKEELLPDVPKGLEQEFEGFRVIWLPVAT